MRRGSSNAPQSLARPSLTDLQYPTRSQVAMKSFFVLASLALSAFSQRAFIISPTNGTTIAPGSTIVIDVHQEVCAVPPPGLHTI